MANVVVLDNFFGEAERSQLLDAITHPGEFSWHLWSIQMISQRTQKPTTAWVNAAARRLGPPAGPSN